ncbi:hypothetical protein [Nocardia niwae]|uniref:hypothetical protein n=1 Tax=Nocardia niwae TaxID=626084 RepID=UPI0007A4BABC|nr:hypothetical protein [Nocardia niwae]
MPTKKKLRKQLRAAEKDAARYERLYLKVENDRFHDLMVRRAVSDNFEELSRAARKLAEWFDGCNCQHPESLLVRLQAVRELLNIETPDWSHVPHACRDTPAPAPKPAVLNA